jgi:PAS domain S-box-containing protein
MRLALATGGALLLALLTWLLLSGINTNVSAYAEMQRALDDFALADASIGRDVLQARAGLLGNYDVLAEAEQAMESAASRIRLHVEAKNLDPKPVEALAASVGQYEDLIERFKTDNSLLQNSLSYVGQLSTDPAFGALGDQFAPSATALAAAVLRLAGDSSPESAKSLQQRINRFEAQAPTGGLEGEAAHALLAHARLLSDLLPEVDQTLRALIAAPTRQPFEETRELLARAQAGFEVTAQRFRVLLYAVSLGLLVIALWLGQRSWTRTLRIRRLVDANIIGIFMWDFEGRILEANEAFLDIVGYDHEDLVAGRIRWTDLTPPEWRDRDARLLQDHRVTGSLQPFEKEYFRKDGTRVPVLIGVATFERSGNQGVAFVLDLTERKRAEQALRRSEAYLAEAQRLSHTGTWVLNPTTMQYLYWSDESYRIWGFDPLRGPPSRDALWQRIHDRDRVWEEVQEAVRQKKDYSGEFKVVLPDGTVKYLAATSHHLFSTNGEIVEVIGTNVDVTERKRAELALRESEGKFRDYAETASDWFWETDPDYRFTLLTDNAFGSASASRIGTRCWDHALDLETEPEKWRLLRATYDSRKAFRDFVYCTMGGTGSRMYVSASGKSVFDASGEFRGYRGTCTDVTERKRAEEALRDSEHALRRSEAYLADSQRLSHTGTWVLNPTTNQYRYWSAEMDRIWGTDPLQGLPSRETVRQRIHPDDRDRVWEKVQEALRQKKDYSGEFRIVLPDGTVKHVTAHSHHLFSTNGELVEVIGTSVDVTERKRADEALRESEGKFRDYAETASDWFWETGTDYKFTLLTENAFGSDSADRVGTACWEHALDLETEPEKWRLIQATLDSRKPFRDFVYRRLGSNGSPMYVRASGKPVFGANGEFRGYRGTGTDVTALILAQEEHERLRQLESDLAHTNRLNMMGELAASLAHEIAQPVATARNNARAAMHFLDRSSPDPGQVREALACVVDDADRAGEILDRIRDHIKKAPPRKERVDLNQAINDVIALAQDAIVENGVSIQTRLAERLPDVQVDCVQLQQVVLNLILNAVEAMSAIKKEARELSISTEQHHADGVLVTVRDSGPGIAPEYLDRVFDAFYTTKSSGVGMGLSICRSIIGAHGGRLWTDANPTGGAVFQFTLPSAGKELTNPRPAGHQIGEPNEDTAPDAPR